MTDFLKIAKSIAFHFAHICAYGVETVKDRMPAPKLPIIGKFHCSSSIRPNLQPLTIQNDF